MRSSGRRARLSVLVALGEGLETQFWRVDDGRVRWLTDSSGFVTGCRVKHLLAVRGQKHV